MNYFPVFFDLSGQKVLIVGGGEVALRKISLLERTGALITVVAPDIAPELMARAAAGKVKLFIREFSPDDLQGARLVIVATSRRAVNRWIASLSESRNIPVNVVDDAESSRFIVPAIIDRDPVLVAVSTGGTSPVLARRLRERLEALIPAENRRIGVVAADAARDLAPQAARHGRARAADFSRPSSTARRRGASSRATSRARRASRDACSPRRRLRRAPPAR